jgi:hypothetical protein
VLTLLFNKHHTFTTQKIHFTTNEGESTNQLVAILSALEQLLIAGAELALVLSLEPRLNGLVLLIKVVHVGYQILDDVHVRQRVNFQSFVASINFAEKKYCE